ncbi:DNA repair helicase XPB [Desulfosporosinus sp. BICA1-9]|uniref:DNA repair helicase XPB n=1 Tax=Desulfosporosinus sp. BICA1-9 TaxID=1531958 RepID=UPI00054B4B4F|nr:DNA repair helicase XPB [Desulfosporosinus sp. BICA1-9]KJS50494.1 MAG: helicase [Peptococcaceae bacterium BRH_c23]KJS90738.1 MAG: helicase [Desulfosporosinus sp. BICA1-9]
MPVGTNPVIVQSDRSVLLEVQNPLYEEARDTLAIFAELEKSPEYIHTYRITPLSLWNAASSGVTVADVLDGLERYSKFPLPDSVRTEIKQLMGRYGLVKLVREEDKLLLTAEDPVILLEIVRHKEVKLLLAFGERERNDDSLNLSLTQVEINPEARGQLKQLLMKLFYPVEDLAGYIEGTPLPMAWRTENPEGDPFALRAYQQEAVATFHQQGSVRGGSGVLVLPCGAGKTVIGMGVMMELQCETLILTTNNSAVKQWLRELADKTTLEAAQMGEYSGEKKEICPVTVATYQILTHRPRADADFSHFHVFNEKNWGLIIYDEVHLLPAPVFRATADLQAKRRLGLTATLVREDGKEDEVFTLIGPKKMDVPWKVLESQGWIATAECMEWRISMSKARRMDYALAEEKEKFRLAAENPLKMDKVSELIEQHRDDLVLVIGQYVRQLEMLARELNAPLITGKTPQRERDRLYEEFRSGRLRRLVVSKVANFAIDLPDANVAIQVSGTFGSRQEEAQRLGRILRPKQGEGKAYFYSLVSKDTKEQEFAMHRQLFLTEQGYAYKIMIEEDLE